VTQGRAGVAFVLPILPEELMEGRGAANGNSPSETCTGRSAGLSAPTHLGRVGERARRQKKEQFTNLGVSESWKGKGVGKGLLKDTMLRTLQAADIAGIRAFSVHAKDDAARDFYEHFDFMPSPTDPLHVFILVKELKRASGLR
jgi:GNAT superfamily N-acetyltransferase